MKWYIFWSPILKVTLELFPNRKYSNDNIFCLLLLVSIIKNIFVSNICKCKNSRNCNFLFQVFDCQGQLNMRSWQQSLISKLCRTVNFSWTEKHPSLLKTCLQSKVLKKVLHIKSILFQAELVLINKWLLCFTTPLSRNCLFIFCDKRFVMVGSDSKLIQSFSLLMH